MNNSVSLKSIKVFTLLYIPAILIITSLSYFYYISIKKANIESLKDNEKFRVSLQYDVFRDEFKNIVSDLFVLNSHKELWGILQGEENLDVQDLEYEFLVFSRSKDSYDQVRLLDNKGMEIIRVNSNGGTPELVAKNNLQDKGERYYFKDTFSLKKGEVFVSPFDLNIEGGEVEIPYKPTIRIGVPIFNENDKKKGAVILNYLGENLLRKIDVDSRLEKNKGYNLLVNSDGYFLKGVNEVDEWGFMLPDRKSKTFQKIFIEGWEEIKSNLSGQILLDQGLFTFDTLYPLSEGLKSSSGSTESYGESVSSLDADKYYWKIVSFIPYKTINNLTDRLRSVLLVFNLLFIVISAISIWFYSRSIVLRQIAEDKLSRLAQFDQLTDLPNRSLLYDRAKIAFAIAKRNNSPLYIFFVDLDGFKKVNDTISHEAGDYVLVEVGKRLCQCVREMDTVARLGGDEFVLVVESENDTRNIEMIANRVLSSISKPISYKGSSCKISASIGIATYPKDGETIDEIINKADEVMYEVKKSGKNNYKFF